MNVANRAPRCAQPPRCRNVSRDHIAGFLAGAKPSKPGVKRPSIPASTASASQCGSTAKFRPARTARVAALENRTGQRASNGMKARTVREISLTPSLHQPCEGMPRWLDICKCAWGNLDFSRRAKPPKRSNPSKSGSQGQNDPVLPSVPAIQFPPETPRPRRPSATGKVNVLECRRAQRSLIAPVDLRLWRQARHWQDPKNANEPPFPGGSSLHVRSIDYGVVVARAVVVAAGSVVVAAGSAGASVVVAAGSSAVVASSSVVAVVWPRPRRRRRAASEAAAMPTNFVIGTTLVSTSVPPQRGRRLSMPGLTALADARARASSISA